MASEKLGREKVTEDHEIGVEKDRVPKMTSHFESLAEKGVTGSGEESYSDKARSANMVAEKEEEMGRRENQMEKKEVGGGESTMEAAETSREGLSTEEISKYRQTAQQNSMEAIRAAEERYNKVKATVAQKGTEAKDNLVQGVQKVKDYTAQTAEQAKEVTVDTAKRVGSYTGEKAVAAKDAVVETGKSAVGYVEEVALEVKEKAVVVGWGVAEHTCERTVEATKAAADVTRGVAGYAGEKAVAAKDVVAHGAQRAVEYTGEKVAAAKDAVVAAEESGKDYAARKKEEAERELEARKSAPSKGEPIGRDTAEESKSMAQEVDRKPEQEFFEGLQQEYESGDSGAVQQERGESAGGGVLKAIAETIVEIAETTKDLVIGSQEQPCGDTRSSSEHIEQVEQNKDK